MARGILGGELYQSFHNYESIYYIGFIVLFYKCATCKVYTYIETIIDLSQYFKNMLSAKKVFMS